MGTTLSSSLTEIRELKSEVTGLRTDLKRFIEHANQQHVQTALTDLKQNYAGLFVNDDVPSLFQLSDLYLLLHLITHSDERNSSI